MDDVDSVPGNARMIRRLAGWHTGWPGVEPVRLAHACLPINLPRPAVHGPALHSDCPALQWLPQGLARLQDAALVLLTNNVTKRRLNDQEVLAPRLAAAHYPCKPLKYVLWRCPLAGSHYHTSYPVSSTASNVEH